MNVEGALARRLSPLRLRRSLSDPAIIVAAAAVILAVLWIAAAQDMAEHRSLSIRAAERENANLALTLGEHNSRALRNVEEGLRSLARAVAGGQAQARQPPWSDSRVVNRMLFVDRHGRGALGDEAPRDLSDRDYFRWHREHPTSDVFVGVPIESRLTGKWIIPVSLRVDLPDGGFGGVVVAGMNPQYFAELYRGPDLGQEGTVALVGADGIVRAQRRGDRVVFGTDVRQSPLLARQRQQPSGHYLSTSADDGVRRFVSYRTLAEYPSLILAVGRAESDVLAEHRRRARLEVVVFSMASLVVLALAWLVWIAARRQRRWVEALARSEERYRDIHDNAVEGIFQTTPDGRYISANHAMARMVGCASPEELIRSTTDIGREYRDPACRAEIRRRLERDGRVVQFEHELVRRDGSTLWVAESARAVRDEDGRIVRFEGILTDISARKREQHVSAEAADLALGRYREMLVRLGSLASALSTAGDLTSIYRAVLAFAQLSAPVSSMFVSLFDAQRRERRYVYAWSAGKEQDPASLPSAGLGGSPHARAVSTGEVVVAADLAAVRRAERAGAGPGADADPSPNSSLVVPMRAMGKVIGAVELQSVEADAYREEHVVAMRVAAPLIAVAVDNARLLAEEREHRQHALDSEARYRKVAGELGDLVDGSVDAICTLDREGRFVHVSAASRLVWGCEPEELVGRLVMERTHPGDVRRTHEAFAEVMAGRPTTAFDNRQCRFDGGIAHVMWSARWREQDQTMFCVARDVTEAKLLAEANRHLAERLHETLDNIASGFATVDSTWRITYLNREAERTVGRKRDELVGARIWDAVPGLAGTPFEAAQRRAMEERVPVQLEEFFPPFGKWFETRVYPTRDGGLAIYFDDVSERRRTVKLLEETETRFEHVALATSDAIWDWQIASGRVWRSVGMYALFGYGPEALGETLDTWEQLLHPDDREATVSGLREAVASQATRWSVEYRFRRSDGGYALVLDRAFILRDGDGKAYRVVGGMSDITERRELERQLERTQRLESLGTLAGGIAHDLNNILTPIMMGVNLLGEARLDPDERAVVETIRLSANRGAEMVRQVLSFARGMEGRRVEVQPRMVMEEVERMIRETFPRSIEIALLCDRDLPTVTGDPTQLHQVLLNLCVNARDAMPEGGTLTITARDLRLRGSVAAVNGDIAPGRYVWLEVRDSGCGIEESVLDRIFDPFFTTKAPGEGTGLGLSTTLAIVRRHGGYIRVQSKPRLGSRFTVLLPASWAGDARAAPPALASVARSGRGQTVMVVDDESGIREMTRRALSAAGYRVVTAANGAEALALFRGEKEVHLVITDMMMPVMDGRDLVRALGELAPHMPIVCTSGIAPPGSPDRSPPAVFVAKPYTAETLVAAVHEALA